MSAYEDLALSYDELTRDVDYPALFDYLQSLLSLLDVRPQRVLDLACGTGSMTELFCRAGYQVTGVDLSEDMLMMAYNKLMGLENRPVLARQAMQELELPEPVDLGVCLLDSLNYVTDPTDVAETFRRVWENLSPGGVFLFDVNSLAKFRSLKDQVWLDETEDSYCVWRTEFEEAESLCRYGVDLFRRRGDLWQRSFEEHLEYAYSQTQLTEMLLSAGFTDIRQFGDRRLDAPNEGDQRIFFTARKKAGNTQ